MEKHSNIAICANAECMIQEKCKRRNVEKNPNIQVYKYFVPDMSLKDGKIIVECEGYISIENPSDKEMSSMLEQSAYKKGYNDGVNDTLNSMKAIIESIEAKIK